MSGRDILLAVLAALIWGATFPLSALALADTPPIFFTALRFALAAAFIVIVPKPPVPWRVLIVLGLILGAALFGLMFVSMTMGISAGLASLLIHLQAFFTILIAMAAFGERFGARQGVALLLALAGLVLLAVDRAQAGSLVGIGLIVLAAVCGGIGNNIMKSLGAVSMLGVSVWMSVAVPLPLFALSLWFEAKGDVGGLLATVTWTTLGTVAYSAILATVVVFAVWGRLLATYSAVLVAPFFLLVPIFGMSLSALVLGESLNALQIGGAVLIFVGLGAALWPARGSARTNGAASDESARG